jgi:hypothetical protein
MFLGAVRKFVYTLTESGAKGYRRRCSPEELSHIECQFRESSQGEATFNDMPHLDDVYIYHEVLETTLCNCSSLDRLPKLQCLHASQQGSAKNFGGTGPTTGKDCISDK